VSGNQGSEMEPCSTWKNDRLLRKEDSDAEDSSSYTD
jgi:hypothetical protein